LVQVSEGHRCALTGRFNGDEPRYTVGWQDDEWRCKVSKDQENKRSPQLRCIQRTSCARSLWCAVQADLVAARSDMLVVAREVISDVFPYSPLRLRWQEQSLARAYGEFNTRLARYVSKRMRANQPFFLDEIADIARDCSQQPCPVYRRVDEHAMLAVIELYASGCVDYVITLLQLTPLNRTEVRLIDIIVALMYLRCTTLRFEGVSIFMKETITCDLLAPVQSLPTIYGCTMAVFTDAQTLIRDTICRCVEDNSATASALQFPLR
jgi:hypothetical protein